LVAVEFDDRDVQVRIDIVHGADLVCAAEVFGGDRGALGAAVAGGDAHQAVLVVLADGGQGAGRVAPDDDARPAAECGDRCGLCGGGGHGHRGGGSGGGGDRADRELLDHVRRVPSS